MKKFNLGLMIKSWAKLISDLAVLAGAANIFLFSASYIETLVTNTLSWWNVFNIFLI